MRLAQISDPHIRPDGVLYKNVADSAATLRAAVAQINALDPPADVVLLTGDVVDEGDPAEYAAARAILSRLTPRLLAIPGNHDSRAAFRDAFADHTWLPAEGPLHFVDDQTGPLRLIALDVTVPGAHHGDADAAALAWLEQALAAAPDRPTVIMMHQPPIDCGIPFLDKYKCRSGDRLAALIARFPAVERVVCGHVHRAMQTRLGGTLLCTAPSTTTTIALRTRPDAVPASFLEPPGFLLHVWSEGFGLLTHAIPIGDFSGPFPFA